MGFCLDVSDVIHLADGGYLVESASPPAEFFAHPKSERARKILFQDFSLRCL